MHYLNYEAGRAELVSHNIVMRKDLMRLMTAQLYCHYILMAGMAGTMGTDG